MKENASLLNCRQGLVNALNVVPKSDTLIRKELIFALSELDAYRHGQLQKCDKCPDMGEPKGP